jgi:predicted nucleic acid-binding protein
MKYLLDSDFLYALYRLDDASHEKAVNIFKKVDKDDLNVLNLVIQESTTLVAKRIDMDRARIFFDSVNKIQRQIIVLNKEIEKLVWKMFLKQTKKGSSFIDCANLVVCQKYKLDGILSFDEFYSNSRVKI